jgi:phosphoglycolate phosphatase-like HAD superfamily hydrolase
VTRHLVWDWNGTLLDDLTLVVAATNASLKRAGGPSVTADEHRRGFRRPIADYYSYVLGRPVRFEEVVELDQTFHETYRQGMTECQLAADALAAMTGWVGSQSLLSMWFHDELVPAVTTLGILARLARVDGLKADVGGASKAPHLAEHLEALGLRGADCVLIGDSIDDADAAVAVGARVVLYSGGFTEESRLRATGHPVARTLTDAVALALAA